VNHHWQNDEDEKQARINQDDQFVPGRDDELHHAELLDVEQRAIDYDESESERIAREGKGEDDAE